MNEVSAAIVQLFNVRGSSMYGGEAVSQLQHALQCAHHAEEAGASPSLIVASLLHDVGHLLHDLRDDAPDEGIDDVHEERAASYLADYFGEDVTEPIRLHVAAKRYLCATHNGYKESLSEPSLVSLALQGGPMNEQEIAEFEASEWYADAVLLRNWDEMAKDPELQTPDINHFIPYVRQCVRAA